MPQQPPMSPTKKSRNSSGNITPLARTPNEGIVKVQYQPLTPMVHSQWLGAAGNSRGSNRLSGICVLSRTRVENACKRLHSQLSLAQDMNDASMAFPAYLAMSQCVCGQVAGCSASFTLPAAPSISGCRPLEPSRIHTTPIENQSSRRAFSHDFRSFD